MGIIRTGYGKISICRDLVSWYNWLFFFAFTTLRPVQVKGRLKM